MDTLVKYEADDENKGERERRVRDAVALLFRYMDPSEPLDRRIASLRHVLQHYEARQKAEATANALFAEMPPQLQLVVNAYVYEWRGVSRVACRDGSPDDWRLPVAWTQNGTDGMDGTTYTVTFSTGENLHYTYERHSGNFSFRERSAYPSDPENSHHDAYEEFLQDENERCYREQHTGEYHYDPFEDEHNQW